MARYEIHKRPSGLPIHVVEYTIWKFDGESEPEQIPVRGIYRWYTENGVRAALAIYKREATVEVIHTEEF